MALTVKFALVSAGAITNAPLVGNVTPPLLDMEQETLSWSFGSVPREMVTVPLAVRLLPPTRRPLTVTEEVWMLACATLTANSGNAQKRTSCLTTFTNETRAQAIWVRKP